MKSTPGLGSLATFELDLRNQIYRHVFPEEKWVHATQRWGLDGPKVPPPMKTWRSEHNRNRYRVRLNPQSTPILHTSKRIREESSIIFFNEKTFLYHIVLSYEWPSNVSPLHNHCHAMMNIKLYITLGPVRDIVGEELGAELLRAFSAPEIRRQSITIIFRAVKYPNMFLEFFTHQHQ